MSNFIPKTEDWVVYRDILKESVFEGFNHSILGLGDITKESRPISALSAVFDLEGFTNFCKQIDPHLAVPNYLGKFIPWILDEVKKETIHEMKDDGVSLWHDLPFFTKFLGDGLLLL